MTKGFLEHKIRCSMEEDITALVRMVVEAVFIPGRPLASEAKAIVERLLRCIEGIYDFRAISSNGVIERLANLNDVLRSDVDSALHNDPSCDDPHEVVLCYPGFKATAYHRIAHIFYIASVPLLPRMISELAHSLTGIDIHPGAQIGSHFFIDHGTGVVIGETAVIGNNVTIYQGVTLGAKRFQRDVTGRVVKGEPRHPIIGDNVTVYSGATILGRVTIGEGSVIGGNVWLTESIPRDSRITQQPHQASYYVDGGGI